MGKGRKSEPTVLDEQLGREGNLVEVEKTGLCDVSRRSIRYRRTKSTRETISYSRTAMESPKTADL
jgi:hypothetical protein